jgi:hypothetical protein
MTQKENDIIIKLINEALEKSGLGKSFDKRLNLNECDSLFEIMAEQTGCRMGSRTFYEFLKEINSKGYNYTTAEIDKKRFLDVIALYVLDKTSDEIDSSKFLLKNSRKKPFTLYVTQANLFPVDELPKRFQEIKKGIFYDCYHYGKNEEIESSLLIINDLCNEAYLKLASNDVYWRGTYEVIGYNLRMSFTRIIDKNQQDVSTIYLYKGHSSIAKQPVMIGVFSAIDVEGKPVCGQFIAAQKQVVDGKKITQEQAELFLQGKRFETMSTTKLRENLIKQLNQAVSIQGIYESYTLGYNGKQQITIVKNIFLVNKDLSVIGKGQDGGLPVRYIGTVKPIQDSRRLYLIINIYGNDSDSCYQISLKATEIDKVDSLYQVKELRGAFSGLSAGLKMIGSREIWIKYPDQNKTYEDISSFEIQIEDVLENAEMKDIYNFLSSNTQEEDFLREIFHIK